MAAPDDATKRLCSVRQKSSISSAMAFRTQRVILGLAFLCLSISVWAAPARIRTSSAFPEVEDDRSNIVWDEDSFDLDGNTWLGESPLPSRSTWNSKIQSADDIDENVINDDIDDESVGDDDDDGDIANGSEFMFMPAGKRTEDDDDASDEVKFRHAAHSTEVRDLEDDDDENIVNNFEVNQPVVVAADVDGMLKRDEIVLRHDINALGHDKDVLDGESSNDEEESYDLPSYPEVNDDKDVDDDSEDDDDDDVFDKPGAQHPDTMFEDDVFLF